MKDNKFRPVAVTNNPYGPWYCSTTNRVAASTILWFIFGHKVMGKKQ